jgi:hypothetical protein
MFAPPHDWGVLSFLLGPFSATEEAQSSHCKGAWAESAGSRDAYDPVRSNAALSPFANPTASPYAQKCMKTSCGSLSSR